MDAEYILQQTNQTRYQELQTNYKKFMTAVNNPNTEPVRVFNPLCEERLKELQLIREISQELMRKKEDDLRKNEEQPQPVTEKAEEKSVEVEQKADEKEQVEKE